MHRRTRTHTCTHAHTHVDTYLLFIYLQTWIYKLKWCWDVLSAQRDKHAQIDTQTHTHIHIHSHIYLRTNMNIQVKVVLERLMRRTSYEEVKFSQVSSLQILFCEANIQLGFQHFYTSDAVHMLISRGKNSRKWALYCILLYQITKELNFQKFSEVFGQLDLRTTARKLNTTWIWFFLPKKVNSNLNWE